MTRIKLGKLGVVLGLLVSCLIFLGPFLIFAFNSSSATDGEPVYFSAAANTPAAKRAYSQRCCGCFVLYLCQEQHVVSATVFLQAIIVPMAGWFCAQEVSPAGSSVSPGSGT